jgi:hypothetical protein
VNDPSCAKRKARQNFGFHLTWSPPTMAVKPLRRWAEQQALPIRVSEWKRRAAIGPIQQHEVRTEKMETAEVGLHTLPDYQS